MTPYEQVAVSDLERTLLDGLARPDLCAGVGQAAMALWMRHTDLDWDRLGAYAERLGGQAAAQRLGYLLELFELRLANAACPAAGADGDWVCASRPAAA